MIYFDSAATSWPKPPQVAAAVGEALNSFGNPARAAHAPAMAAARSMLAARQLLAGLFGADDARQVVFTKNVTEALNLAINSVEGHILTTAAEHNAVLRPIYRRGNYSLVPVDEKGRYTVADVENHLQKDTAAVVVAHASNLTGNLAPIGRLGALCRQRGLLLIVDAAQTAGLFPINVQQQCIDALCFTGHKSLYGPQGTGGVVVGPRFDAKPLMVGGSGSHSFLEEQPPELPERLEAGTANAHGIAGLLAGAQYAQKGAPGFLQAAGALARRFYEGAAALGVCTFYGDYDAAERAPIVTLNVGEAPAGEVAAALEDGWGIMVRAGAHCAPLLHRRFGTQGRGAVRFSFSHHNTKEEVDAAVAALRSICSA